MLPEITVMQLRHLHQFRHLTESVGPSSDNENGQEDALSPGFAKFTVSQN